MPYRMQDDSVTRRGKGHPAYAGKSVTHRGEEQRLRHGPEPGRYDIQTEKEHPERIEGRSTARDTTSVRPKGAAPILPGKMPDLR